MRLSPALLLRAAALLAVSVGGSGCVVFAAADAAGTVAATAVRTTARVGGAVVDVGAAGVDAVTTSGQERELERYREHERECRRERRGNCGPDDR